MNVLVTGGAGFIGSNLAARLVEAHRVKVLDNLSSGYSRNLSCLSGVELIRADVRDGEQVDRALEGIEVVFHLAASVGNSRSISFPVLDSEVNVLGTLRLLEAARKSGVRKFVFSSSAGIFGELKTLPIREDHPVEPDSPYGVSKLAAEKLCLAYGKLYGIESVCLRYFNVYGVNQRYDAYGNVIPIFAHRILRDQPLTIHGDGEQTRDFVNVADVVQANLKAGFTAGAAGAFNIASGTRVTINRLAEMMFQTMGIEARVEHGPPRPGDVRHSVADITTAQRGFGFEPKVGLESGLAEYLEWARGEMAGN